MARQVRVATPNAALIEAVGLAPRLASTLTEIDVALAVWRQRDRDYAIPPLADPVISLMRCATRDTVLGGKRIHEGDRLLLWFPSANRDETVFDEPYRFDVTRHPNLHLGFGAGPHFCLGGPLAKIEIRLAMEELLARYDGIEITGPVTRVQSSFVGGLKHLPVRLVPHAA